MRLSIAELSGIILEINDLRTNKTESKKQKAEKIGLEPLAFSHPPSPFFLRYFKERARERHILGQYHV
jgi:hypothetical protein